MNKLYDREGFCVFGAGTPATSFTTRSGATIEITGTSNFGSGGMNRAQLRHLDPSDDFSVYEDMDIRINLNHDRGDLEPRFQEIHVPSPAKQWRYWHRRMNGGS